MNDDRISRVRETMRLRILLCWRSRCTIQNRFGCGVARPHNAIIMFGNKVQPSRQLPLTSIEIQMLLNLHLKPFPLTRRVLSSYISTAALRSRCNPRMQDGALSTIVFALPRDV